VITLVAASAIEGSRVFREKVDLAACTTAGVLMGGLIGLFNGGNSFSPKLILKNAVVVGAMGAFYSIVSEEFFEKEKKSSTLSSFIEEFRGAKKSATQNSSDNNNNSQQR
jgi:hypothetical protein